MRHYEVTAVARTECGGEIVGTLTTRVWAASDDDAMYATAVLAEPLAREVGAVVGYTATEIAA